MRGLIRWILFAILLVIAIILIVNFVKRSQKPKQVTSNNPSVNVVEKEPEEDTPESLPDEEAMETDLTVDSPNTASSGLPEVALGIVILTLGVRYIYKNGKLVKGNS